CGHPRGGRRRLVPLRGPDRPDRQDGGAEALPRRRHLRGDPAQGRDAELGEHPGDQQGPERADLRVLRPRRGRRPAQDRPQADRGDQAEERRLSSGSVVPRPRRNPQMAVAPSEYPPPFDSASVITAPTDPVDERIEVGVAIVGGGPAGLACANKLMQLLENEPELTEKLGEVPVAVIEKGKVAGAHLLSGANMKPSAMEELFPDLPKEEWPVYGEVEKDAVYVLTKKKAFPLKPPPPGFKNHGNYVTSVSKLGRFLADKAEEAGVYILSETAATQLLVEDRVVKGVRSGDRGRGKEGEELGNFEPGSDVVAKATVLAEGTVGHLSYAAYDYFDLHGADPMRWELGVKEVWEVSKPLDRVIHTMGWPLRKSPRFNEFGGSFIYPMGEDKLCI